MQPFIFGLPWHMPLPSFHHPDLHVVHADVEAQTSQPAPAVVVHSVCTNSKRVVVYYFQSLQSFDICAIFDTFCDKIEPTTIAYTVTIQLLGKNTSCERYKTINTEQGGNGAAALYQCFGIFHYFKLQNCYCVILLLQFSCGKF